MLFILDYKDTIGARFHLKIFDPIREIMQKLISAMRGLFACAIFFYISGYDFNM